MKKGFTLSCKTHSSDSSFESSQDALCARAFTLAEVLLTLAIIGVVAALTIPAVITKVTQDQYVVGLKKAYNTLKSVEREAIQEHGEMKNWPWGSDLKTTFETYFLPYFDVLKNCGMTTDDGCFSKDGYKAIAQSAGGATDDMNTATRYKIIASDGIAFAYFKTGESLVGDKYQGTIFVDVNGPKKPNVIGRDLFQFNVFPSPLGIKPNGANEQTNPTSTTTTSNVDASCNKTSSGMGWFCATKVLSEGAMNY